MMRFIAGIALTLLVQAVGWPAISSALDSANQAAKRAYAVAAVAFNAAETEVSK